MQPTKSAGENLRSLRENRISLSEKSLRLNFNLSLKAVEALTWISRDRDYLSIKNSIQFMANKYTQGLVNNYDRSGSSEDYTFEENEDVRKLINEADGSEKTRKTLVISNSTARRIELLATLYNTRTSNIISALSIMLREALDMTNINAVKEAVRLMKGAMEAYEFFQEGSSSPMAEYLCDSRGTTLDTHLYDCQVAIDAALIAIDECLIANAKNILDKHNEYIRSLDAQGYETYSMDPGGNTCTIYEMLKNEVGEISDPFEEELSAEMEGESGNNE